MSYHKHYDTETFPPNTTGLLTAVVPQKRGDNYTVRVLATNVCFSPDGSITYSEISFYETARGEYEPRVIKKSRVLSEMVQAYKWQFVAVSSEPNLSTMFVGCHDWTSTISEYD